jgi:hypothetical protein
VTREAGERLNGVLGNCMVCEAACGVLSDDLTVSSRGHGRLRHEIVHGCCLSTEATANVTCACVRARARGCVCACVCVCARVRVGSDWTVSTRKARTS